MGTECAENETIGGLDVGCENGSLDAPPCSDEITRRGCKKLKNLIDGGPSDAQWMSDAQEAYYSSCEAPRKRKKKT